MGGEDIYDLCRTCNKPVSELSALIARRTLEQRYCSSACLREHIAERLAEMEKDQ